jgi:hypothetical protein
MLATIFALVVHVDFYGIVSRRQRIVFARNFLRQAQSARFDQGNLSNLYDL